MTNQVLTGMPLLRGLLEQPLEQLSQKNQAYTTSTKGGDSSTTASTAAAGETVTTATSVPKVSNAIQKSKQQSTLKTATSILRLSPGQHSTNRYNPYVGDLNTSRGNKLPRITLKDLQQELHHLKIYEPQIFINYAAQHPGSRAHEIWWDLSTKPSANWKKQLALAVSNARAMVPDVPYIERIENWQEPNNFNYNFAQLYYQDYRKIFDHHGITKEKIQKWFKTLAMDNGKRCTIYMCGRANSGKTTIIELLSAFYEPWEIGRAQPQSAQSNFFLQDLVGKRLFHADEILATPLNIDTIKLLLEGNKDLASDIKYGDKETIIPRPVLIGTNDPLWINFSSAAEPILARCEFTQMKRPMPKMRHIKPKDSNILRYVLKELYKWAFDSKGYATWFIDAEIEASIDAYLSQEPDFNLEQITNYSNGN